MSPVRIPKPLSTRVSVPLTPSLRRAMLSSNTTNATGLKPEESKALPERQPTDAEQQIIAALKEMYSCKPKNTTYNIYTEDATFQDPIGIANGLDSIKAQFNGLAKLFSRADVTKLRVLESPPSVPPGTIVIDQVVAYYFRASSDSPTKTLNSLLTLHTNDQQRVTRHIEEWDHKHDTDSSDGFFGLLNQHRRSLTAAFVDKLGFKEPPNKD